MLRHPMEKIKKLYVLMNVLLDRMTRIFDTLSLKATNIKISSSVLVFEADKTKSKKGRFIP